MLADKGILCDDDLVILSTFLYTEDSMYHHQEGSHGYHLFIEVGVRYTGPGIVRVLLGYCYIPIPILCVKSQHMII